MFRYHITILSIYFHGLITFDFRFQNAKGTEVYGQLPSRRLGSGAALLPAASRPARPQIPLDPRLEAKNSRALVLQAHDASQADRRKGRDIDRQRKRETSRQKETQGDIESNEADRQEKERHADKEKEKRQAK